MALVMFLVLSPSVVNYINSFKTGMSNSASGKQLSYRAQLQPQLNTLQSADQGLGMLETSRQVF